MTATAWLHDPHLQAIIGGVLSGAAVDIQAFIASPTWRVDGFRWTTATKRWVTGGLVVLLTQLGLSTL